jgi:TatD DNase family protein
LRFIDTHCHINSDQLRADASAVISRAREAGVGYMLTVGSDPATSAEAVKLAHAYGQEGVYAAIGVHPHDSKTVTDIPEALSKLAEDPRVVAIGETGLDYYYDHSPRDAQGNAFRRHVEWASKTGKPLVIHVRDAMADALKLLDKVPFDVSKIPLVFHCYAGGLEYLNAMKDLDAYLSIGGPVTWAKSDELREVAARVAGERLLCETDSPWLTPKPYRGKLNEPAYVRFVYEEIAKSRGVSVEDLARTVDANAARLFGWEPLYA